MQEQRYFSIRINSIRVYISRFSKFIAGAIYSQRKDKGMCMCVCARI